MGPVIDKREMRIKPPRRRGGFRGTRGASIALALGAVVAVWAGGPAQADFILPDTPANRSRGVVGCVQRSSGSIDCAGRSSGSSSQGGSSPSAPSSAPSRQEDYRQRQIEADAIRKRQSEAARKHLDYPDVQSGISRGEYRARRQQNEAANIEAIRRLRQLREGSAAQKEPPHIDKIEVPAPSALDQQTRYRDGWRESLWEKMWRLWDSPERLEYTTWLNDPMHREWLSDAFQIASFPMDLQGFAHAIKSIKSPVGRTVQEILAEEHGVLFPGMFKEAGSASGLKYAEELQAISKKYGVPFDIVGSLAETELGKMRRANPLLREVLPEFRQEKWWWSGGDIDIRFSEDTLKKVGPERALKVVEDVHKVITGKSYYEPGGWSVDVAYSKIYPTEEKMKGLPALRFEPGGWRQEMGWGAPTFTPPVENKVLYENPKYGLNLRLN